MASPERQRSRLVLGLRGSAQYYHRQPPTCGCLRSSVDADVQAEIGDRIPDRQTTRAIAALIAGEGRSSALPLS
jgi:hypothetical protein